MRSSILSIHDPSDLPDPAPEEGDVGDVVEEELAALARRRSVLRDHEVVARGDVVRLSMAGPAPRFTKPTASIAVGLGLLDAEFEESLIGLSIGRESIVASSDGDVTVIVASSQYRDVPDLDDDLVVSATDGRFSSVDEFRTVRASTLRSERLAGLVETLVWDVVDEVVRRSEIAYDPAEICELVDGEFARCRALTTEEGLVFDDLSPQDLAERTGVETIPEFRTMVTDIAHWRIGTALVGARLLGEESDDVPLADLDRLVDATITHYRTRIAERATENRGAST